MSFFGLGFDFSISGAGRGNVLGFEFSGLDFSAGFSCRNVHLEPFAQ